MSKTERDLDPRDAVSAEALLRRIFDIVSDEASRNPELMTRLMQEIAAAGQIDGPAVVEEPTKGKAKGRGKPKAAAKLAPGPEPEPEDDELSGFNPVAMVSEQGADALRDHLRFVRKKDPLARIAKRYALDVPRAVLQKKASLPKMIDAIIEASERRVREQELSGG